MFKPRKHTQGFTLLELVLVVALIGLLSLASAPNLRELWLRYQSEAQLRKVEQLLRFSRLYAVSQQRPVQVCPLNTGHCHSNWSTKLTSLAVSLPTMSALELQHTLIDDSAFELRYDREAVIFRPDGSLDVLGSGSFILCTKEPMPWHFRLTLSQAGRYRSSLQTSGCPLEN